MAPAMRDCDRDDEDKKRMARRIKKKAASDRGLPRPLPPLMIRKLFGAPACIQPSFWSCLCAFMIVHVLHRRYLMKPLSQNGPMRASVTKNAAASRNGVVPGLSPVPPLIICPRHRRTGFRLSEDHPEREDKERRFSSTIVGYSISLAFLESISTNTVKICFWNGQSRNTPEPASTARPFLPQGEPKLAQGVSPGNRAAITEKSSTRRSRAQTLAANPDRAFSRHPSS